MSVYFGIDLSGPANPKDTALAIIKENTRSICVVKDLSDADLLELQQIFTPAVIGIDAPLSYQDGGGFRPGDRALRKELNKNGFAGLGVMSPTYTKMVYLTLRGMSLADRFIRFNAEQIIFEVHPGGYLANSGYPYQALLKIKKSKSDLDEIVKEMHKRSVYLINPMIQSDHELMAVACALAVREQHHHQHRWRFDASPEHPFPIIC